MKKKTPKEFIKAAKEVHGNKYDYKITKYTIMSAYIKIRCKEHGIFMQEANAHLRGNGCPECGQLTRATSCKYTTKEFIERAKLVHGTKYTYARSYYKGKDTHITVTCKKHGDFVTIPNNHVRGYGCPKCKGEDAAKRQALTTEEFIKRANKAHKGKYKYNKTKYTNQRTHVLITCNVHGDFKQLPEVHTLLKCGCPKCGRLGQIAKAKHSVDKFIERAKNKYGETYNYELVKYTNARTPVSIICKKHGVFQCSPWNHMHGGGCLKCSASSGETAVAAALDTLCIKYETQRKLPGCRSKTGKSLIFDFVAFKGKRFGIIEYDGAQHEIAVASWGGEVTLRGVQARDRIKNRYATENNIPILRIKHTQGSIKLRIKEWLKTW